MDLLSRALASIRFAMPYIGEMRVADALSLSIGTGRDMGFHYVAKGAARICSSHGVVDLTAGDFVLVQDDGRYLLEIGPASSPIAIEDLAAARGLPSWRLQEGAGEIAHLTIGDPPFHTQILSGIFGIRGSEAEFFARDLPRVLQLKAQDGAMKAWLDATYATMVDPDAHEPGFSAVAMRTLEVLFIQALRTWSTLADAPPVWWRGMTEPRVRLVLRAIHDDPTRDWTLREFARISGQSRSAFAKSFAMIMGETPFHYLRRWRMHRAAAAIRDTDRSIAEIAGDAGYATGYPFIRAFKAEMGMTPTDYRRVRRGGIHKIRQSAVVPAAAHKI